MDGRMDWLQHTMAKLSLGTERASVWQPLLGDGCASSSSWHQFSHVGCCWWFEPRLCFGSGCIHGFFWNSFSHESFEHFLHVVLLFAVIRFCKCGVDGCEFFLRQLALAIMACDFQMAKAVSRFCHTTAVCVARASKVLLIIFHGCFAWFSCDLLIVW